MSKFLGVMILVCAGYFYANGSQIKPIIGDDIGMSEVFHGDKLGAKKAAAYFYSIADTIDWDAHNDKGELKTDGDIVDYRVKALNFETKGQGFETKYPGFGAKVGAYLDQKIGTVASDKFDDERRAAWIHAWRSLGDACASAGKGW